MKKLGLTLEDLRLVEEKTWRLLAKFKKNKFDLQKNLRFFLKLKIKVTSLKKEFPAEILKKKKFVLIVAFFN